MFNNVFTMYYKIRSFNLKSIIKYTSISCSVNDEKSELNNVVGYALIRLFKTFNLIYRTFQ